MRPDLLRNSDSRTLTPTRFEHALGEVGKALQRNDAAREHGTFRVTDEDAEPRTIERRVDDEGRAPAEGPGPGHHLQGAARAEKRPANDQVVRPFLEEEALELVALLDVG